MAQSVAVAIVHGIGRQKKDFASPIIEQLRRRVAQKLGADPEGATRFFFQPVYWAPVLQNEEDDLWSRLRKVIIDTGFRGNRGGRQTVVARDHDRLDAHLAQVRESFGDAAFDDVLQFDHAEDSLVV